MTLSRCADQVPRCRRRHPLFGAATRGLLIHLDDQGMIRLYWNPLNLTR